MKIRLFLLLLMSVTLLSAQDYRTAKEHGLMEGFPPPEDKRITADNALMFPPYNRWSYQHMRMFYPTAPIKNADKSIKLTKVINNGINSLMIEKATDDGKPAGEKVHIDTWLKETYTDAIVVVKGNVIVYEAFLNGMTSHTPHQMMSVTKSFAGLFGLLAVEEGKISEETVVGSIIPELASSGAFSEATFGQVLDMSNSMDFTEDYADPDSVIRHYGVVLGMMEADPTKSYAQSIYEYLPTLQKDPAHEHGEVFHYQTPKTDVVNWVTNRATGADFQDNMYNYLWSKLGTDGETYVLLDKNLLFSFLLPNLTL